MMADDESCCEWYMVYDLFWVSHSRKKLGGRIPPPLPARFRAILPRDFKSSTVYPHYFTKLVLLHH